MTKRGQEARKADQKRSIWKIVGSVLSWPINAVSWLITGYWAPAALRRYERYMDAMSDPSLAIPIDPATGKLNPFELVYDENGNPTYVLGSWAERRHRVAELYDPSVEYRSPIVTCALWLRGKVALVWKHIARKLKSM